MTSKVCNRLKRMLRFQRTRLGFKRMLVSVQPTHLWIGLKSAIKGCYKKNLERIAIRIR